MKALIFSREHSGKDFSESESLPEVAQDALLRLVEVPATKGQPSASLPKPQFGSAKGLIKIGPEFDEPLEDFRLYTE